MIESEERLAQERRVMLADKARRLYGKFCGTGGRGICAESFAVYHISRGEATVAVDLAAYLDGVVSELESTDPHGRLAATRGLAARIRRHLAEAVDPHATPNQTLPQTGEALRLFVTCNSLGPSAEELVRSTAASSRPGS
ncbi:MAG: hypothetical protein ACRC1K_13905 [Planctomycetia bacterium]